MKKLKVKSIQTLIIAILFSLTFTTSAQPPNPNDGANVQDNKVNGNGAPIGGGLFILLGLGAVYGGKKLYDMRKECFEE